MSNIIIEIGKSYVTTAGDIVTIYNEDDILKHSHYKFECEYRGPGPDTLWLKNWKDANHKDYMKTTTIDNTLAKPVEDAIMVSTEGKKNDTGKPMFSCLPPDALMELGKVAELGARKYGLHNYRKGIKVSRILDAAFRHLIAAVGHEDHDQVDGNNHLASAAWNCLTALQMIKDHPEIDDRFVNGDSK